VLLRRRRRNRLGLDIVARPVEGDSVPPLTQVRGDLRSLRFKPETERVWLHRVTAERVDFSDLGFWGFHGDRCRFVECDFSGVRVEWLPFGDGGSLFQRCSFRGARIGDFGRVRLEECDFSNADLSGWFTWHADIVKCRFAGQLTSVVFEGTSEPGPRRWRRQHRNVFRGNDFRLAELDDVAFRGGIDLDDQLLPVGSHYVRLRNIKSRVAHVRAEVSAWPATEAVGEALTMLDLVGDVYEHEDDVFVKRSSVLEMAETAAVGERILDRLEKAQG
jgi:hypothetical protein